MEGIYNFNVGEGDHRRWSDCKRLGFISAGQGKRWRDAICRFQVGDLVVAYLKGKGFVGIGRIVQRAKPIREVSIQNLPLTRHVLDCKKMSENIDSDEKCEYVALVKWDRAVESNEAAWKEKSDLYTTQLVRSSIEKQQKTLRFLEEKFGVDLQALRERRREISD